MGHIVNDGEVAVFEGLGNHILENGSGGVNPPKFKKRRVSAVRDFPKGCGRFAAVVNGNGVVVDGNGGVVRSAEGNKKQRDVVEQLEESPLSPKSSIQETAMPLKNLEQADNLEPMKSSEHMIVDVLPLQSIPTDKIVEGLDNHQTLVTVGVVAENMPKKYYRRRSVSAYRDFPPGCGRNAAPINSKEFQELVKASKDKSLVNEKKDEVGDASKCEIKEKITKKIGEGAQVKAEVGVKKHTVEQINVENLSKSALKQEHTDETIIKTPRESLMSKSDSRPPSSSKNVGKGSGGSGEKQSMESVKLKKDASSQSKLPVNSIKDRYVVNQTLGREYVGLDSSEDRVIVQAIMAEPNCPWSQAKKTSQPATGNQSQVGQGKKTLKSASGKQSQVEQGNKTFKSTSNNQSQLQMVKYGGSQSSDDREIVQSLMAAPNCPWRQGSKWPSKGKKQAFVRK